MHSGPVPKSAPPTFAGASAPAGQTPAHPLHPGWLIGRSLIPIVALVIIVGTVWWGPYVTLILALAWWRLVTQVIG